MFLFFSLKRKETFFRCILPSSYFILQFCLLSFFVILVLYKVNIGISRRWLYFKDAVIMLILYLQKALCLKLSLDIFATNIEKVLKKNIYSMLFL